MMAPDKVVVPQYNSKEILIINLATAEENTIPFEYQSKEVDIFYFPDSDLVCIQERPCRFGKNRRNYSFRQEVRLTYFSASNFDKPLVY